MRRGRTAGTISTFMKGFMDKVLHRSDTWAGTHTTKSPGIYHPPYNSLKQKSTYPNNQSKPRSPTDVNTLQEIIVSVYVTHVSSTLPTCSKPISSAVNKNLQPKAYYQKHNTYSNTQALTLTPNSSFENLKWNSSSNMTLFGTIRVKGQDAANALQPNGTSTPKNSVIMFNSVVMDIVVT